MPPPGPPDPRRWWTLAVLCLSLLMVVMGNTVLNVALPTLVRDLGASRAELQWLVDAYSLVFAGLLFTGGALGDRFGRKGALSIGLILFGTGSALAVVADDPAQLIACRAIMGAAGALVMPATLSILANTFEPRERARAIGVWAGVAGIAGAVGPIASGWLLAHFWWGSVFFLNLPIVVIALVSGRFLVPTSRDPRRVPLDLVGAGLSIVGVSSLVYAIIEAPDRGWSDSTTLAGFAVSAVLLGAFAAWELSREHPMLDLRYFKRRGFTGGSIAISLVFFGMFGMFFLSTQYLQLVRGYTALGAGVRLLPFAMTMMVVAPSSARIAERIGTRATVTLGLAVAGVGHLLFSTNGTHTSYLRLALSVMVLAAGMGLTMAPSTASIMSSLPLARAGIGSAMNDTDRELGGALGVAVLGSLAASRYVAGVADAIAGLPSAVQEAARSSLGGALRVAAEIGGDRGDAIAAAAKHSYTDGMSHSTRIAGVVALIASVIVARVLPTRVAASEQQHEYGGEEIDAPAAAPTA